MFHIGLFLTHLLHYFYLPTNSPWYQGNVWGNVFVIVIIAPLGWLWSKTKFWPFKPLRKGLDHLHLKVDHLHAKHDEMKTSLEELHVKTDRLHRRLDRAHPETVKAKWRDHRGNESTAELLGAPAEVLPEPTSE